EVERGEGATSQFKPLHPLAKEKSYYWATLVDTKQKYLYSTQRKITQKGLDSSNATLLPVNSVIFSSRASIGEVCIAKVETATNQGYKNFVCDENVLYYEFLYFALQRFAKEIESLAQDTTY
ncbi:restriction endonuclease subunit S, partial [Helicobacter trogontum]|uniref:restriction endonuclease subunit S n=1 Tax=Helicobacter trogontum TaxID=50960 RepID=UPI0034E8D5DC